MYKLKLDSPASLKILNMGIRAISMLSRFILVMILAKLLPASELGTYGLLVAAISFAVLFVGFDYYTYSNRELLSVDNDRWSEIILNQLYAYIPLYLVAIPFSFILNGYGFLPKQYFTWFLTLFVIEHISIEQNRLLNTMQKQLSASFVLFLRSGIWIIFMLPLLIYVDGYKNLETVLYAWVIGGICSILYGIWVIKKSIKNWTLITPSYSWIIKGYKVGVLFILGTLSFRLISTGDKFLLEQMSNINIVGVYVFYSSLTVGATAFIHAGVIVFSTPKIITAYHKKDKLLFKRLMNQFFKELSFSIILMILGLYFFMPYVVTWIGKSEYFEHYEAFYIILITASLTLIGSHPGTYLYAARRDKYIVWSNVSVLIVFLVLSWIFYTHTMEFTALYRVSILVMLTFLWSIFVKYIGYFYYSNKEKIER